MLWSGAAPVCCVVSLRQHRACRQLPPSSPGLDAAHRWRRCVGVMLLSISCVLGAPLTSQQAVELRAETQKRCRRRAEHPHRCGARRRGAHHAAAGAHAAEAGRGAPEGAATGSRRGAIRGHAARLCGRNRRAVQVRQRQAPRMAGHGGFDDVQQRRCGVAHSCGGRPAGPAYRHQ